MKKTTQQIEKAQISAKLYSKIVSKQKKFESKIDKQIFESTLVTAYLYGYNKACTD